MCVSRIVEGFPETPPNSRQLQPRCVDVRRQFDRSNTGFSGCCSIHLQVVVVIIYRHFGKWHQVEDKSTEAV